MKCYSNKIRGRPISNNQLYRLPKLLAEIDSINVPCVQNAIS